MAVHELQPRTTTQHNLNNITEYGVTGLQPYLWVCANCGWQVEESMESCPKCQNRVWGKIARVKKLETNQDKTSEPEKFTSPQIEKSVEEYLKKMIGLFNSVECGTCHAIIFRPEGEFNRQAFESNLRRHYSKSPNCKPKSQ